MDASSLSTRRKAGRPHQHENDLQLLLFVELGSEAAEVSVKRFCDTNAFVTTDGRRLTRATLRRRYYQRHAMMRSNRLASGQEVPSPVGNAYELYIAGIRATIAKAD